MHLSMGLRLAGSPRGRSDPWFLIGTGEGFDYIIDLKNMLFLFALLFLFSKCPVMGPRSQSEGLGVGPVFASIVASGLRKASILLEEFFDEGVQRNSSVVKCEGAFREVTIGRCWMSLSHLRSVRLNGTHACVKGKCVRVMSVLRFHM